MNDEIKLPVEVRLVVRDRAVELDDTHELLNHLQDIVNEWYWKYVPTIPCSVVSKGR
jgi:hypothetical protein